MPRSLLPPRGVYVPTIMVYNRDLSSTVIHTWIQLRGLAWGRFETPQLSIPQLSELTGKSRSTIFGHMALLRHWGALRWRSSDQGTLIVTFPVGTGEFALEDGSPNPESRPVPEAQPGDEGDFSNPESRISDLPDPPSLPSSRDKLNIDSGDRREGFTPEGEKINDQDPSPWLGIQKIGQACPALDAGSPLRLRGDGQESINPESIQKTGLTGNLPPALHDAGPVKIYQSITGIRPKQLQRDYLNAHIIDINIWYASLQHWLFHGWNPKNLAGLIQLYQRGGPSACRYCSSPSNSSNPSLSALHSLREELKEHPDGQSG